VRRLPIRLRLTAAFAAAMLLVLAGTGLFVYLRLKSDLNESVTAALKSRAAAVTSTHDAAAGAVGDPEEAFVQVLDARGRLVDSAHGPRWPVLSQAELQRAESGRRVLVERYVPGIDGTPRILARRAGRNVVVVGQSLGDRDETLSGLVTSFAVGGPIAVLVASLLGYGLATAGLRPVEAMRRRAREVSLSDGDDRLPLPAAHDEIRRLGETLNEMLERLRGSFERERRFVADASHELRTPVAVIKTELEGALRSPGNDPAVTAALSAAVEECDHLAQLAEDLLVVARSGEGELPLRREPVDARDLLERVRDRFADRADRAGREIRLEGDQAVWLDADPLRLQQALGNLVDNALRYGAGEIVLRRAAHDELVELSVNDAGRGFPAELADRAFERFARGDDARTRGGTGLGLAIVKTIAEAHGGTAEIVPGTGATVRISLRGISAPGPTVGFQSTTEVQS
jgi:two-component system, OmpR family, sensor kinase